MEIFVFYKNIIFSIRTQYNTSEGNTLLQSLSHLINFLLQHKTVISSSNSFGLFLCFDNVLQNNGFDLATTVELQKIDVFEK